MPNPFSREPQIDGEPSQENQWQVIIWQAPDILLRKGFPRNTGHRDREVSQHSARRRLINRRVRDADRTLLLIRLGVFLQVVVQRCVTAIETAGLVGFFQDGG